MPPIPFLKRTDVSGAKLPPWRWCLVLPFAVLAGTLISGPAAADALDLQPLAYHGQEESDLSLLEILWPVVESRYSPAAEEQFFRPLFHHLQREADEKSVHVLYPIGLYHKKSQKVTAWVFPVYFYAKRPKAGQRVTTDYTIFPVFFKGQHRKGEKYMAILPFGGTLRDLFLKDKIELYTLLYIRTTKGDLRTNHLFGPLVGWSEGSITGGRFWPLYAHYEKKGQWKRSWALWPLFHLYAAAPSSGKDRYGFIFIPVFARKHNGPSDQWSVLFPFFGYARNKKTGSRKWSVPWPFIEITSGLTRGIRVWPVFGTRNRQTGRRSFALWPFFHHLHRKDEAFEESATWFVPIFWSRNRTDIATGRNASRWQLWPLARSQKNSDGSNRFAFLALLPFRDPEGFDKIYAPFWELYVRKKGADGSFESYALWRLYTRQKEKGTSFWRLAPIFSQRTSAPSEREWKALFGLIQHQKTKDSSRWKLFYLWHIERSGKELNKPETDSGAGEAP